MTTTTRSTVERFIGQVNTNDIYSVAVDVDRLEQAAQHVILHYKRDSSFPMVENLIINLVKFAVQDSSKRSIQVYDNATALIGKLALDEGVRSFVSDSIFLTGFLETSAVQIFRG